MAKKAVEAVVETAVAEEKPVKKTTRKRKPTTEVFVEFGGIQVSAAEIIEKAQAAFTAANEGVAVKNISIYVKPEEKAAYYVVNGEGSDSYKVEL